MAATAEPQSSETQGVQGPISKKVFAEALKILEVSSTGQALLKRATQKWRFREVSQLVQILEWGKVSKTDSVLTRHYDPDTGKETRERRITIYLRQGETAWDIVLDLAHELSHALDGPSWDPYDPRLTPGRYIWESLEGRGGEVDAVHYECQIASELSKKSRELFSRLFDRCVKYLSDKGLGIDRNKIKKDFYQVGKWLEELKVNLGREEKLFPLLSPQVPQLYSSTGNSPYPVALLDEYQALTSSACQNMASRLKLDRSPASVRKQTQTFLSMRCGHVEDKTTLSYSSRSPRRQ